MLHTQDVPLLHINDEAHHTDFSTNATRVGHAASEATMHSFVEHLLGVLLEFTAAVHVTNLLRGGGRGAVCSTVLSRALLSTGVLLINDHTLSTNSIFLGRSAESLIIATLTGSSSSAVGLHARLLSNDVEHRVFQGLFVLAQSVLFPSVIEDAVVEIVPLHAAFEVV